MNTPSTRTMRLLLASGALVAMCGITVSNLASSALFTDAATTAPASVTSGAVTLALGGTASTTLAVAAMAPGDSRYGVVSIANTGSLQSRFSGHATWSVTNSLTSALALSVRSVVGAGAPCDGSLAWGTGDLATNQSAASGQTSVPLFGSSAAGAQTGDRSLNAATTEYLCVRLALPSSAGNGIAGLTSALTLGFDAEQTANNS